MPDSTKIGSVVLKKMPEGKTPEHYRWKKVLEKVWAGEWTLAQITEYRYRVGLDPSFVEELPPYKKGRLHWYEWLLCENGGIIFLNDEKNMVLSLLTATQTAEKVLDKVVQASLWLILEDRLSHELHFQVAVLEQVCELAGVRKQRQLSSEAKMKLAERGRDTLTKLRSPAYQQPEAAQEQL